MGFPLLLPGVSPWGFSQNTFPRPFLCTVARDPSTARLPRFAPQRLRSGGQCGFGLHKNLNRFSGHPGEFAPNDACLNQGLRAACASAEIAFARGCAKVPVTLNAGAPSCVSVRFRARFPAALPLTW